jgi:RNA polymerase sigma factor (sigma-70 family)
MQMAERLLQSSELAARLSPHQWVTILSTLLKFFEWRRCESPEDMAQETLLRGLTRIAHGAAVNESQLKAYFIGIAKNVLREEWKAQRHLHRVALNEAFLLANEGDSSVYAEVLRKECLRTLSADERHLVVEYASGRCHELARTLGITHSALRVRVHRVRRKLLELIEPTSSGS